MESFEGAKDESMDDVFLQDDLGPTIAEHAAQCQSLFHKYMAMPEIVPDRTIIDDQLARFSLWASNMDIYGPLNVSLDYRLRFSPTAADIIHQLLDIICDTLLALEPIDDRPTQASSRKRQRMSVHGNSGVTRRDNHYASDSESDDDPVQENILKITETIGGTLTRLFRLSNAVRKSAKANRARKIERYTDDDEANKAIDELRHYTRCYIEFRFPNADKALCSALVEANALRLRRLFYQRSHRKRIHLTIQSPETTPAVVELPKMTGSASAVRFALPQLATSNKMPAPLPAPATNATTARQTAVAAFYTKSTTEVPRSKSVLVNNKLSFPPIPPTQQCPYCGVIVEFKNTASSSLWQNHVIGDLEPFICVSEHCLDRGHDGPVTCPLTFETSKAWSNHMQTAHGHIWECRAPSHDPIVFNQEILYQEHSIKEHGVPELHAGTLSNAARRPVLDKIKECLFGDDFKPPEKAESSAVFSSDALQLHVAGHLKEIALFTLQKLPSDDEENVENVDSDQPLEDDGPAGAFGIIRASMDSILADEDLDFRDEDDDDDTEAADGNLGHPGDDISARVTILDLEDKDGLGMSELHYAVQAGDVGLVGSLIQSGASVNSRDENGQTPLHYAAERGFIECMEVLVNHGANLHIRDNSGFSPFLWAVVAGQEDAMGLLFKDSDVNASSADGKSALAWVASLGMSPTAKILFEHHVSVSDTQNAQQILPLEEAAASGNFSIVLLLLEHGADPNHRDRDGWSAIHWAAEEGHLDIVHLLLDRGANPNAVSSYGTAPLHCAANGGHVSIVSLLLQYRADPLKSTCHGWTALHHAAFMGHSHVVQSLLEDDRIRATASQQDNHGWSVLHLAVHSRDLATVRILLGKAIIAEPQTLVDESGLTAEEWLDRGPTSHSQKATSNLAFSKSRCCRAITSLRQAASMGSIPLIKLLVKIGHDIDGMNSGRRTALYYAAKNRMPSIMDLLLDLGADPNILPTGRKNWEEVISSGDVLLRLNRAGYKKPDTDTEVERQIRKALRLHSQPSVPAQPVLFVSNELTLPMPIQSVSHGPERPSSSVSTSSTLPSPDHAALSRLVRAPALPNPKNDNKRKARSGRTDWWKRLVGGG